MRFISPLFSDARNKLGGTVFARNPSGLYTRPRVAPTQPRTVSQQAGRAQFAMLTQQWRTLTQDQIQAWNTLALTVLITDSMGQQSHPTGFQLFVGNNRNLLNTGRASITDAPAAKPSLASPVCQTVTYTQSGGVMTLVELFSASLESLRWAGVLIAATGPLSPGITFVAPYQYRTLPHGGTSHRPGWSITSQYNSVWATAVSGSQVGTRVRYIDPLTGFASADFTALNTIA